MKRLFGGGRLPRSAPVKAPGAKVAVLQVEAVLEVVSMEAAVKAMETTVAESMVVVTTAEVGKAPGNFAWRLTVG